MSTLAEPGPVHASSAAAGAAPGDPLGPVLNLGRREVRIGLVLGLIGALLVHGVAVVWGLASLFQLGAFAQDVKGSVDDSLRATLNVQVVRPPPPPPAAKAPAPEPQPPPPPPPERKAPAPHHPAAPVPAAAQAGKILARKPSPLDLTGQGFVTGNADSYAGGVTSSGGTSKTAVTNPNARGAGSPGTGVAPQAAAAPAPDLSRAAMPTTRNWNCGFPPEADRDEINSATVTLVVTVGANGQARSVTVLHDPGHGFGRQARQCAFGKRYHPGLDRDGRPVAKTTPPFTVRFNR